MSVSRFRILLGPLFLALAVLAGPSGAATQDDNVEWAGVSHVDWQDRRPLCPIGGESFRVRFQVYHYDITGASVQMDDGAVQWIAANFVEQKGVYDVWEAVLPATASTTLSYWIRVVDGTDEDYLSVGGMTDGPPVDGGWVLDYATLSHAPLGATFRNPGAVFKVWAPTRTTAHVRGDFNAWGLGNPLTKVGEYFIGHVPNVTFRQQYKYFFNNSHWNSDPRARSLNASNSYNSHVEDPFRYLWSSNAYLTPQVETMVIYQLHVGTFAGRNDPKGSVSYPARFTDVAARVSHLKELGVNAVMFNPVTEFPTDVSAGYNPITAWAPEWRYGTPDAFKVMVDSLHANGIAVLLDIVWNHFSGSDNYLWNYDGTQIYFDTPAVSTPWGDQLDFDEPEVADYFVHSAMHWMEEMRVDGFRMDATDFMNIFPQEAAGWALMQRLNDVTDARYADKVMIAEQLPDDSWVTRPTSLGGAGFDAQYYDRFTDDLRQEIVDAGLGDPEMWKIRDILLGGGQYLSGPDLVNYLELHDEAWPTSGGQRMVKTIDTTFPHDDQYAQERTKLAQGLVLTAPGTPAILQGTEWLEDTDWGDGFGNRIDWSKKTTYAHIFRYFQDLIAIRTGTPAFRSDSGLQMIRTDESQNVVSFLRIDGAVNTFAVIANFSNVDRMGYRIGVPKATPWQEILNSDDPDYGGGGLLNAGSIVPEPVSADGRSQSVVVSVPARGLVILSDAAAQVGVPGDGSGPDRSLLRAVHPNPFRAGTTVEFSLARPGDAEVAVFDLRGRRVALLHDGRLEAGDHAVRWDGRDAAGNAGAAGIYFIRLRTEAGTESRKVALFR